MDPVLEEMAAIQHDIWAHWMKYMFSKCQVSSEGMPIIPKALADRWARQVTTKYADLPEEEKQSDREVVNQFMLKQLTALRDSG